MSDRKELEKLFRKQGYSDFKWIDPKKIVVSQWVRMKCTFGCRNFGKSGCCPPETPSVDECERFFHEYQDAVIFHFEKKVKKPEDRHAWTATINKKLLELEREVFLAGNRKAFLLFMDSCELCKECAASRRDCYNKKGARPAPEAMAMDVFATVEAVGYPIEVLTNYKQAMNRYAFLMVR
jgi:predicted metal-binding protein